jgi:hypothetical protein
MSKLSAVSQDSARAGLMRRASAELAIGERFDLPDFIMDFTSLMPNKSLETTPVGGFRLPRRFQWFHIAVPGCLSFFR